jgi:hypothetical protein
MAALPDVWSTNRGKSGYSSAAAGGLAGCNVSFTTVGSSGFAGGRAVASIDFGGASAAKRTDVEAQIPTQITAIVMIREQIIAGPFLGEVVRSEG